MSDNDPKHPNFPVWVPPGEHDRPKPGSAEVQQPPDRPLQPGGQVPSAPVGASGQPGWPSQPGGQIPSAPAGASGQPGWPPQPGGQIPSAPAGASGQPGWPPQPGAQPKVGGGFVPTPVSGSASPSWPARPGAGHPATGQPPGGPSASSPRATGAGGPAGRPPERKSSKTRTATITVIVVACVVASLYGAYKGFVALLEWSATKIPVSWEKELGKGVASSLLSKQKVCADPRLNAFIQKLGKKLESGMTVNPFRFRYKVVDVKQINAFALPGGYVFINRGLIKKAKSAEEIAGVLAHEVQHVLLRHGMKRLMRTAGFLIVLRVLLGDMGGFVDLLAEGAVKLTTLKHDRGEETEADMEGLKLLYRAGVDPNGMPMFFQRLADLEKGMSGTEKAVLSFLSTHPLSEKRMKRLRGYIEKRGKPKNLGEIKGFEEVRELCTPVVFNKPDKDPSGDLSPRAPDARPSAPGDSADKEEQ